MRPILTARANECDGQRSPWIVDKHPPPSDTKKYVVDTFGVLPRTLAGNNVTRNERDRQIATLQHIVEFYMV